MPTGWMAIASSPSGPGTTTGLRANALTDYCRWGAKLEFDVLETAILTTAAYWAQPYQWNTHVKNGLDAGLSQAMIDAIRADEGPRRGLAADVADLAADIEAGAELERETRIGEVAAGKK